MSVLNDHTNKHAKYERILDNHEVTPPQNQMTTHTHTTTDQASRDFTNEKHNEKLELYCISFQPKPLTALNQCTNK